MRAFLTCSLTASIRVVSDNHLHRLIERSWWNERAIRTRNSLRIVHRARSLHRTDKFGFASALPRSSAKFTGDRSTSNGKWARVPSDEVNSASRRRRNRRKTSSALGGGGEGSGTARRSLRQPGENAKTLINVFCAVFTVLEYRAGGSLKSYKHLPACSLTCKTRCAFDEFFVGTIYCNVTIHAKEMLRTANLER